MSQAQKEDVTVKVRPVFRPEPNEVVTVITTANERLDLRFEVEETEIVVADGELVFAFPDGGSVVVVNLFEFVSDSLPEFSVEGGEALSLEELLELYSDDQVEVMRMYLAALESGLPEYQDDPGNLIDSIDRLGKLDPFFWGSGYQRFYDEENMLPPRPDGEFSFGVSTEWNGSISATVYEDGQPAQNVTAHEQLGEPFPGRLSLAFNPQNNTTLESLELSGFEPGTRLYLGDPNNGGTLLEPGLNGGYLLTPDQFQQPGIYLLPPENYSGDMNVNYTAQLTSPAGSDTVSGSFVVPVDSVADLADAGSDSGGGNLVHEITISDIGVADGWTNQVINPENYTEVTFMLDMKFYDLDGSEVAWVEIELPPGFAIPNNAAYQRVIGEDGSVYARIPLPSLALLRDQSGEALVPITIAMTRVIPPDTKLNMRIVTHETDDRNSGGHSTSNNTAVRVIEQEVSVDLFNGKLGVKVGWAYEGNDNTHATSGQDIYDQLGLDPNSTIPLEGAPIIFTPEAGTTIESVTITVNPHFGSLYNGNQPMSSANGVYTLTPAEIQALQTGQITFRPAAGHSDQDVPLSYTVTLTAPDGEQLTVTGNTAVVIDAVADAAVINGGPEIMPGEDGSMVISTRVAFSDVDGSERHYILVEASPGWQCLDPHVIITVYYGAGGEVLQPIGYDSQTGEYIYPPHFTTQNFFKVDVTAQSLVAGGNEATYKVNMRPPSDLQDQLILVGTLSEETYGQLNGREYDPANNQFFVFRAATVTTANSDLILSYEPAYEDHMPKQNQGDLSTLANDGRLTLRLLDHNEYVDNAPGNTVVIEFTYNGTGLPGSFEYMGVSYALGNPAYESLGNGRYRLTLSAEPLPDQTGTFYVRYTPRPDDDRDLIDVTVSLPVRVNETGYTTTMVVQAGILTVDAAADKPVSVNGARALDGSYTAAVSGQEAGVRVQATFGDYTDDSESHYLIFDLSSGFNGLNLSSLPAGYQWSVLTAAQAQAAGLGDYADGARYMILQVPNDYLRANNGVFNNVIRATVDQVTTDSTLTFKFKAVAVENNNDGELTPSNNIAETDGSFSMAVHVITSVPLVRAGVAYENDERQAHIGQDGSNGAPLSLSGMHSSENLTSITFTCNASDGSLLFNGQPIAVGVNISIGNGLTLRCDLSGGTYTVSISGGSGTVDAGDQISRLSFAPADNYRDGDVNIEVSGTIIDNASGATKSFGPQTVPVIVDAVAQQPEQVTADVNYDAGWVAAYDKAVVTAKADFQDTDGSSRHYLMIEAKSYFDTSQAGLPPGAELFSLAYDAQGRPLTPAPGGGWLDPYGSVDTVVTPASTRTFIRIEVTDAIENFTGAVGATQTIGPFEVTLNADGSYSVSWSPEIAVEPDQIRADFTGDPLLVGGMSQENAVRGGSNPASSGQEAFDYNNAAYQFENGQINVAVVETLAVTLHLGFAYEQNSPQANEADPSGPGGIYGTGNGAGILVSRETPPSGDPESYHDEQITITFTFNALPDGAGGWVVPGSIWYNGAEVTPVTIDPVTGQVSVTVTLDMNDTTSILDSRDVSGDLNVLQQQVEASGLRFVPSESSFNEADVNLSYSISVEDTKSGATKPMAPGSGTVVIDAVADRPVISDVEWQHSGAGATAYADGSVTLQFNVNFKDTGALSQLDPGNGQPVEINPVLSEGQYILVQQTLGMDLTEAFKQDVLDAGFHIDTYPVGGQPYYRIPAAYFTKLASASGNSYEVSIPMQVTGAVRDQAGHDAPRVIALSIVESSHGSEPVSTNNTSPVEVDLPPLNFAVVDSYVSGGQTHVYENNNYPANDQQPDGAEFSLGLVLGNSLNDAQGQTVKEEATNVIFTYDTSRGELSYFDGTAWQPVTSAGVPPQFVNRMRFKPNENLNTTDADQDVLIHYEVTFTDPASGAQKPVNGDYLVIVDAVAEKPQDVAVPDQPGTSDPVRYNDEVASDGKVGFGESVEFTVNVTFPDYAKSGLHSQHYILVEVPGDGWELADMTGVTLYIYNNESYFRVPVTPGAADGSVSYTAVLKAPAQGSGNTLVYDNSKPVKVGALTVDRDPNISGSLPAGDREWTYDNNWAVSDLEEIHLNYDEDPYNYFSVSPLYENNTPDGNLLNPDGSPNSIRGGGAVNLPPVYDDPNNPAGPENVTSVTVEWTPSDGDLYVGGVKVTPTLNGSGKYEYEIPSSQFGDVRFQTPEGSYSDADWNQVTVTVHTDQGNSYTHTASPVVDAVAQVPVGLGSGTEYPAGNSAVVPGQNVTIQVTATFPDGDGSENHYVLVEARPGWGNPNGYPVIVASDGKAYYQVQASSSPGGTVTQNVVLTTPGSGGTDLGNGRTGYDLGTGAMSVEKTPPSGYETRSDNNTAFNTSGTSQVITSTAESRPVVQVTNTYAGGDRDGDGAPDAADDSRISLSGLNASSDDITQVVLTYPADHGELYYDGVPLSTLAGQAGSGVSITSSGGNQVVTITNPDIINSMNSGSGSTRLTYKQTDYSDGDVRIDSSVTVQDKFSSDTATSNSNATIIVDAVAREATDVSVAIVSPDYGGAVAGGGLVEFAVTGKFPALGDPNSNERSYLALQQVSGWEFSGGLPPEISIVEYGGVPYYVISIDTYGNNGSPTSQYLSYDPNTGVYTFRVPLTAPQSSHDVQGAANFNGGAVTIVESPSDGELNLNNNLSLSPIDVPVNIGVVETTDVSFTFAPVAEDAAAGSAIGISQDTQGLLTAHNEKVTSSTFDFTGDFTGKSAGDQVGTIIYDGKAYPVIYDGTAARATVDFGTDGFDASRDFRMIWGTVATDGPGGTGNVLWDGPAGGTPQVTDWNHTGGNMDISVSSTVEDKASGASQGGVSGSSSAEFTPAADAPIAGQANDPAGSTGSGAEVSFTVSGTFVDVDGSERHYFLVEQKPGWTGNYAITVIDGVSYFTVPADSDTVTNATATVTLTTPPDLTEDQAANLKVGGMSVDGADTAHSFVDNQSVNINIGVADSTAVSLAATVTDEDTPVRLDFSVNGNNDEVTQIVIHDLQGGWLEDSTGAMIPGNTLTYPLAQGDGNYYYHPAPNFSGQLELSYTATVKDSASGQSKTIEGQTGNVVVDAVTDQPVGPQANTGAVTEEAGHQAGVELSLEATFPDNSGTEEHFFVLQLPAGVTPPPGLTPITDAKLLAALGLTGQTAYRVEAGVDGTAALTVNVPQNTSGASITYHAVAVEKDSLADPAPDYKSASGSVALPATGDINLAPTAGTSSSSMTDALRDPTQAANGQLAMSDPDGDAVSITGAAYGSSSSGPVNGVITIAGTYGTLTIDAATGAYSYTLTSGARPPDGFQEKFTVTVSDQTDASSANININLNAPNTPPPTQQLEGAVGGTGPGTASGAISLTDPENDAVSISEVLVNGTAYSAGPGGVYTIAGLYGTFVLRPDGTYDYTLTNQNATGVDVLEVVREDSFGATSTATVNIDVTPVPSGVSFLSRATDSGAEPFLLPEAQASSEGELGRSGSESERSGPFTQDALQQPSWLGDQSGKLDVSHLESILAAAEDLLITGSLPREVPSSLSAAKPFYTAPELGLMLEEQGEDLSDCLEGLRSFFGELKYGSDHALSAGLNLSEGITNEAALLFESGCALAGAEIEQWNPACMEDRTDAAMLEMIIRTESGG